MKIIISPAKKMNIETDLMDILDMPVFMEQTEVLFQYLKGLSYEEAKKLWECSEKLAKENYSWLGKMELKKQLTPALLSYEGIQYQYMAPNVFDEAQWEYVQKHLRILSGFYGVLRPLDGIVPYRLEMQAKIDFSDYKSLYQFWGDSLYKEISRETDWILNLASKEYSKCIEKYLDGNIPYITCVFGVRKNGRIIQKATLAKMARGEMVRYLAENRVTAPEEIKKFTGLGFIYQEASSTETVYVFVKEDM